MTLLRDFYSQTHTQPCCFHPLGVYTSSNLQCLHNSSCSFKCYSIHCICQTICDVTSSNFLRRMVQCEQKGWHRDFRMSIANDTYHVRTHECTNVPTSPALCLSTPVLRQNPNALSTNGMPKVTYTSHTYNRFVRYKFSNGNLNFTCILPPGVTVHKGWSLPHAP